MKVSTASKKLHGFSSLGVVEENGLTNFTRRLEAKVAGSAGRWRRSVGGARLFARCGLEKSWKNLLFRHERGHFEEKRKP